MITETGKDILGKYLVGTAPAYASYIAVGCGAQPVLSAGELDDYSSYQSLDFEMFRVPITSRGFIEENGETRLVFSADVPTTDRYEITEIGVYSAAANPSAIGYDSRTLYAFTREESWKYNEALLTTIDSPLDNGDASNDIFADYVQNNPVIQTNATNRLFANAGRQARSEQSRYLNNMIMLSSNFADLSGTSSSGWTITAQDKISLATALDLSKNSPNDLVKLALSVVDVDSNAGVAPNRVRVVVEFTTEDDTGSFRLDFESVAGDFTASRYLVLEEPISSGTVSGTFLWSKVNNVNIYAAAVDSNGDIIEDGSGDPTYYIALDAIRLENISSPNPLYGLTGYTVVQNSENGAARPIIKLPNTAAMVEFRLGVGIYNG
jgi:hypothetical protein